MNGSTERVWQRGVQLGKANQEIVELARRHCLNMEFVPGGGRGMVEAETGLPVDMRQVRCPVALGGMASNLRWIATEFYREHCIGCAKRHPTGDVPNLATMVNDADTARAAAATREKDRLAQARALWVTRDERRRALAAGSGEAMAGALADIGVIDRNPDVPIDADRRAAALARLTALADRKPELFTADVVTVAVEVVESFGGANELLDPLRRLALSRQEFSSDVARAAVAALRRGPVVSAGRCIADLGTHVPADLLDQQVCTALVHLAGAPALDQFGRSRPNETNDPTGLRAAAGIVPDVLARVLREMLPAPSAPTALVLPSPAPTPYQVSAHDRATAAGAVRALATTHPDLATSLVNVLILDLAVVDDEFNDPARPAIERTLAVLLILGVGDVEQAVDTAGRRGGEELRGRLLHVMSRAADLISPNPRWREPGDPTPDADRRAAVAAALLASATARLSGDWGDRVRVEAADLIKDLAGQDPGGALANLPALLGAVLTLIDADRQPPPSSRLDVPSEPPQLNTLEPLAHKSAVSGALSRVLGAVEAVAAADPAAVCSTIAVLVADERDTERGTDLLWWLLRTLGRIGSRHGSEQRVLRTILPILHSYLVDSDVSLRARAIDAWTEIATYQELPSSLLDLLPALLTDTYVAVARALARAAARLDWPNTTREQLLMHALGLLHGVDPATQSEAVKDAITAAIKLVHDGDKHQRAAVEQAVLAVASHLDSYDLRDALDHAWLPTTERSAPMARLRLRQAADLQINDRWNAHDDRELCALLACGPGLTDLPLTDLSAAALALAPERPLGAAEFAEVAWRAGRADDAVSIMVAVLNATPDQPAYASHRLIVDLIRVAAEVDAAAAAGRDWTDAATRVTAAASALTSVSDSDVARTLATSCTAALEIRHLLTACERSSTTVADPAQARRQRANALAIVGATLAAASRQATDTGAYLRAVAAACDVGAHLLRADAAALDADTGAMTAHATAATRRADVIATELAERFAPDDPLAGPLYAHMAALTDLSPGTAADAILARWVPLPIPVPVVTGPRRRDLRALAAMRGSATVDEPDRPAPTPVAVVLASVDSQLISGPEVLRADRVYDLQMEVQSGIWPDWADRLDGELLTHLTPAEITTPEFTWSRGEHAGDGETYTKNGPLVLRFSLGPGQPAPPLLVRLTWRGARDGEPVSQVLDITGHRELRLRPFDHSRDRVTDYPVFDERLLSYYEQLTRAGYDADQLQAFCRLLTAICRVSLRMTWEKKYRRGTKVSERTFHDDLHERLLADPELGGRVDRGNPLALGYLDVRHDGITAELKVERKTPVTRDTAPKYMGQPTQYAAADGARLSILTILDMSPKVLPIGTPENYLFTLEPRLHGLDNPEAPSRVAVLVVNGNMPTPSSWSRRKTPTTGDTPS
ncbi:hypothetical protein [Gandjariella thermophila]|uniref:Uncharacterized protein n=1 Tax=Gandjariella thermophila TaxID=1931992 RepID=A0A4D4JB79_9PSEU|nr:hypothetical protein [Gandjariella thermophila]GDY33921.1 hypothetical protein GTS_55540 [Gandjariella thermophila]